MRVDNARDLGALVRDIRKRRGLSQGDLAEMVGVSRQWISGLEQGRAGSFGLVLRTLASLDLDIEATERTQKANSSDLQKFFRTLGEQTAASSDLQRLFRTLGEQTAESSDLQRLFRTLGEQTADSSVLRDAFKNLNERIASRRVDLDEVLERFPDSADGTP